MGDRAIWQNSLMTSKVECRTRTMKKVANVLLEFN
jgi:hypothetical protein